MNDPNLGWMIAVLLAIVGAWVDLRVQVAKLDVRVANVEEYGRKRRKELDEEHNLQ